MPEMPEVAALAEFLGEHALYKPVSSLEVVAIGALKTFDPPPSALAGRVLTTVERHGKFLDLTLLSTDAPADAVALADAAELHLVIHLARGGWLRWSDELPQSAAASEQEEPGGRSAAVCRRLRLHPHRGRYAEAAGRLRRAWTRRWCPASPASARIRSRTTSVPTCSTAS